MSQRVHKISRRKIYCRNASTIGYGRYEARPGDWIAYREHHADDSYQTRMARVVGVVSAPADGSVPAVKDKLCVVALNDSATFCYERWIDPDDVREITSAAPRFLAYFASADPAELIAASEYGSACASHTDWQDNPLPCGYPGCTAPHLQRPDGTPSRWPRKAS